MAWDVSGFLLTALRGDDFGDPVVGLKREFYVWSCQTGLVYEYPFLIGASGHHRLARNPERAEVQAQKIRPDHLRRTSEAPVRRVAAVHSGIAADVWWLHWSVYLQLRIRGSTLKKQFLTCSSPIFSIKGSVAPSHSSGFLKLDYEEFFRVQK